VSSPALQARSTFLFEAGAVVRSRERIWLHVLLLALTLVTTAAVGSRMQYNFDHSLPVFDIDRDLWAFIDWYRNPAVLLAGLPFSLTLLAILLAHEFGHYLACVYYGVDASLPYFLPAPTFTGTFGAFIRIRSPILSKSVLFDIGIAGPIAGFIFLLPALTVGLAMSKVVPGIANAGSLHFGTPLLLWLFEKAIFPGVGLTDLYLHPVVRAGWVGVFATAMNLLPIGQLDGGHILYALGGERHSTLSRIFLMALLPLGYFFWTGWIFWAVVLFFVGRRHPAIYDPEGVGSTRRKLGWLALAIFILSFMPAPI
jgi:membrane-associated protease RseP (regulator of RpoE activity)